MYLKFKSDGSVANHGFRATYAISDGAGDSIGGEEGGEGAVGVEGAGMYGDEMIYMSIRD